MLILKRLLVITTLIVLLTGVTVPTIDVSADKKSDNDKRKQAKAWIKEKYENYKDYKKEQKEQKEKEKQYKKDKKEKEKQYKKDQREKEKQYKKDQREKIKQLKEEQSQKRDDHKKEQKHDDDDDDDDYDDDYKKEKDDDDKKEKDDDYQLGEKFKCKFNGGYYSPMEDHLGQSIVSIGIGECDSVSNPAISYGKLIVSDTLNDNDCYDVVSKSRSQSDTRGMKIFNKKGSAIYIEITGEQCFQNGNGDKITPTGICGRGIFPISTFDGKFTITNDAKGSGTFSSTVTYWVDRLGNSYCDSEYPLGSLFESKFNGSILLPVDNFAVPHTSFT